MFNSFFHFCKDAVSHLGAAGCNSRQENV